MNIKLMVFLFLVIGFNQSKAEDTIKMTEVMYQEASPGLGNYPYRLLVNDKFLRFDGGQDTDGFILLDRINKKIISVNHDDQSRFIIQPKSLKDYKNEKITVNIVHSTLDKSPKLQGVEAKSHDIVANENLCRQVLSFDGILPEVTKAWKEYEDLMQAQNQQTLSRTPQDMQTDCFITNNISHASAFLEYGLPFSIKSKDGTLRILQNYKEVTKPKSFVEAPASYREFSL